MSVTKDQAFQLQYAEMYRKYEVIIDRIQVYDGLANKIEALDDKIEEIVLKMAEGFNKVADVVELLQSQDELSAAKHNHLADKLTDNVIRVNEAHTKHGQLDEDVKSTYQGLQDVVLSLGNKVSDHIAQAASKEDVKAPLLQLAQKQLDLQAGTCALQAQIDDLKTEMSRQVAFKSACEANLRSLQEQLEANVKQLDIRSLSAIDTMKTLQAKVKEQWNENICAVTSVKTELENMIKAIPSVQDLSDKMNAKISLIEIDNQNQAARFANTDQTLKFIEKKSESLHLRVTNLEMKNKG